MSKIDYEPIYEYKENQYYKLFIEEKEKLKSKYPEEIFTENMSGKNTQKVFNEYLKEGHRELHLQYLKELADIIFQTDGNFQKFTWDTIGEVEQMEMERRARGRNTGTGEYR